MVDHRMSDDACLGGQQKRFAAGTDGQMEDIVGAEVVQKTGGVAASEDDLAVVGPIEEGGAAASLVVLRRRVAIVGGDQPAGLLGEAGPGLDGALVERGSFTH